MDLLQFLGYLEQYSVDVVIVGALVAALDFVLKKLLKDRLSAKLAVFLPFALGAALYLAYGAAFLGHMEENAGLYIRSGFSCGSFATAAKVIVSQFLTKGKSADRSAVRAACVKELLSPYALLSDEEAASVADLAETDEEGAEKLILSLCEGAPDAAAEFVIGALKGM